MPNALEVRNLDDIVALFPPVRFAAGYGSGVFRQRGYSDVEAPMIDMIFAVDDTLEFHAANVAANPDHYSFLRHLGIDTIQRVQESAAHVYFNTLVPVPGIGVIKYGVISVDNLVHDLTSWDTLYVSGRLHKPVAIAKSDKEVGEAMRFNCEQALTCASLLLGGDFTEAELFEKVASLSYQGDVRMGVAENPEKIRNIVEPHLERFASVYSHAVQESKIALPSGDLSSIRGPFRRVDNVDIVADALAALPSGVRAEVEAGEGLAATSASSPDFWCSKIESGSMRATLSGALARIVKRSSAAQSSKGLATAGLTKSLRYVAAKVAKRFRAVLR